MTQREPLLTCRSWTFLAFKGPVRGNLNPVGNNFALDTVLSVVQSNKQCGFGLSGLTLAASR